MKIKTKHVVIGIAVCALGIGFLSCVLVGACFFLPFVNRNSEITVTGRIHGGGIVGDDALFDALGLDQALREKIDGGGVVANEDLLQQLDNPAKKARGAKMTAAIFLTTKAGNEYICQFRPGEEPALKHNLQNGMNIVISGTLTSSSGNVHTLSNCRIIGVVR